MTSKKEECEMVRTLREHLMEEKGRGIECIIMDIPISSDPEDPIRQVVDEVLGDFVEIQTPNGTFFFPTSILRS